MTEGTNVPFNNQTYKGDFNVILDGSLIEKGIEGAKHALEATVGTVPVTGEKLLDLLMRIDACNGSGVIASALNAMHALQNLLQALQSASGVASVIANPTDLLKQLEAAGINVAMTALSNFQSILAGSLFNALSSTFCSSQCGPLGNAGGFGNNPLGALANLAGMSLQEALNQFGSPLNAVTNLANRVARNYTGGAITQLPPNCVIDLTNTLLGNLNLCGLLSGLLNQLANLATQEPFAGKPGFGAFTFMGKILDIIEALMAAITAGMALLRAVEAMNVAIRCSGYSPPQPTRPARPVPQRPIRPRPPQFDDDNPGGGGGFDDIAKDIENQANVIVDQTIVSVVSYRSTNELPLHIPRDPLNYSQSIIENKEGLKVSITANSTVSQANTVATLTLGSTTPTNIPRKGK